MKAESRVTCPPCELHCLMTDMFTTEGKVRFSPGTVAIAVASQSVSSNIAVQ